MTTLLLGVLVIVVAGMIAYVVASLIVVAADALGLCYSERKERERNEREGVSAVPAAQEYAVMRDAVYLTPAPPPEPFPIGRRIAALRWKQLAAQRQVTP